MDRFAEKYVNLNPYQYAGNNPIKYVDMNGDSLIVAKNRDTKDYINEMVAEKNRKYIKYNDDGSVGLDFGDLSKKDVGNALSNDDGLAILSNIIEAVDQDGRSENFYFEVSNHREGRYNGEEFATDLKYQSAISSEITVLSPL